MVLDFSSLVYSKTSKTEDYLRVCMHDKYSIKKKCVRYSRVWIIFYFFFCFQNF